MYPWKYGLHGSSSLLCKVTIHHTFTLGKDLSCLVKQLCCKYDSMFFTGVLKRSLRSWVPSFLHRLQQCFAYTSISVLRRKVSFCTGHFQQRLIMSDSNKSTTTRSLPLWFNDLRVALLQHVPDHCFRVDLGWLVRLGWLSAIQGAFFFRVTMEPGTLARYSRQRECLVFFWVSHPCTRN